MKKTTLFVDFEKNLLVMNQAFATKARNVRSEEYKILQATRRDYPTYAVVKRRIKRNSQKETYAGLTYDFMRMYIATHEPKKTVEDVMNHFDKLLLISQCHCKARRYPVIKSWFLEKYPEIEGFGKAKEEEATSDMENDSPFEEVMRPLAEETANIEPITA